MQLKMDLSRKIKCLLFFCFFCQLLGAQDLAILNKYKEVVAWQKFLFVDSLDLAAFDFMDDDIKRENYFEEYLPQQLVFSELYRHKLNEVVLPEGLINYSKEIFEDIKLTLKPYPRIYRKIQNTTFKIINGSNPPLDLAFSGDRVTMTSALLRSLFYLSVTDFEFELEENSSTEIDEHWMYASLFYVRFYGTLSFMLHHELAHLYLKKGNKLFRSPKKHQKMEERCDCFALALFQKSIEKDLYVQWTAEGSMVSYNVLMKSIVNLGEKQLWGIDNEKSIKKRLNQMDENLSGLIEKCELKFKKYRKK